MYGISVVHKNSKLPLEFFNLEARKMVGAERFELSTSCTRINRNRKNAQNYVVSCLKLSDYTFFIIR